MIERKLFPYEILLRFASGQDHETAPIGAFAGAHYVEMELLVEQQGEGVFTPAAPPKLLPARVVDEGEIAALCGALAANFSAGLDAERAAHAATKQAASEIAAAADAKVQELTAALANASAECDRQTAVAKAQGDRLNAVVAALG